MKITYTQEQEIKDELNDFKNRLRREGERLFEEGGDSQVAQNHLNHSNKIKDLLETL